MILLTVKYQIKPGKRDEVLEHLGAMKSHVTADEPGCLAYEVWESRDEADVFRLHEVYADEAALEAHRVTPHYKDIVEGHIIGLLDDRVREFYTPLLT